MKKYIVYHGNCADGFGAAYAAWKAYPNASFVPYYHGDPMPDFEKNSEVYFVDMCPSVEQHNELCKQLGTVFTVIDHHKTALEVRDKVSPRFRWKLDMEKSGAMLSWEYFHKTEAPVLIRYIQDRDLWHHKLPFTHEVSASLKTKQKKFELWDLYANNVFPLIEEGKVAIALIRAEVKLALKQAHEVQLGKHKVWAVNTQNYMSDVAHALIDKYPDKPFTACYYIDYNGNKKWSLRSKGGFDCAIFCRKRGGGGHMKAAGFIEKL